MSITHYTMEEENELFVLDSAIAFCRKYPQHSLQDAADHLKQLKKDIDSGKRSRPYTSWSGKDLAKLKELHLEYGTSYTKYMEHFPHKSVNAIAYGVKKIRYGKGVIV